MPHAFLSYSRKDKAFVNQLYATLESQGFQVWVDWEDIPPSVDWMREIEQGIRSADNFVLIISPDSITSRVCYIELQYALSLNKHLIPVLYRDVTMPKKFSRRQTDILTPMDQVYSALGVETEAESMFAMISPHNWIMFRETDSFSDSVAALASAIRIDAEDKRHHTELLMQAHEWQKQGRNTEMLLSGEVLSRAEAWLDRDSAPQPVDLQITYVEASRQATQATTPMPTGIHLRCGIDMIEIKRVEQGHQRLGERYLNRFFTSGERSDCDDKPHRLAARLAAKEAVAKALGTGIGPVSWLEIEIRTNENGRPLLYLHGAAEDVSRELGLTQWDISLTHTKEYASAIAVAF